MQRLPYVWILLVSSVLPGCGAPEDTTADTDRETVFDPLVETLDEAEQVEDVVLQQKRQMDEALRSMEGEEGEPEA